ncbi:hypothetical protein Y1Q_0008188 [Alligator mississippiensis]|uniref:Uncharacterized protein n=1 Tax=Alligator mississippiensis TaxID=8496 RepID=A0A151N178_ALLMI|nr:hypothetical protein Y1Q_0008188 [Alligator mississippiensis]
MARVRVRHSHLRLPLRCLRAAIWRWRRAARQGLVLPCQCYKILDYLLAMGLMTFRLLYNLIWKDDQYLGWPCRQPRQEQETLMLEFGTCKQS